MKNGYKIFLSVVLVVMMLLNVVPVLTFAEETPTAPDLTADYESLMSMTNLKGDGLSVKEGSGYTYTPDVFQESMSDSNVDVKWNGNMITTHSAGDQPIDWASGNKTRDYSYVGKTNIPLNENSSYVITFDLIWTTANYTFNFMFTWPESPDNAQCITANYLGRVLAMKKGVIGYNVASVNTAIQQPSFNDYGGFTNATKLCSSAATPACHNVMITIDGYKGNIYYQMNGTGDYVYQNSFDLSCDGFTDDCLALGARSMFYHNSGRYDYNVFDMSNINVYGAKTVEEAKPTVNVITPNGTDTLDVPENNIIESFPEVSVGENETVVWTYEKDGETVVAQTPFTVTEDVTFTAKVVSDYYSEVVGMQYTAPAANTQNVRFLAALHSLNGAAAGFEITASYLDENDDVATKSWEKSCNYVYSSIIATSGGGTVASVTANELGGTYLVALSVDGVPVEADVQIDFVVKSYVIDGNGEKQYSETKTFTLVGGVNNETVEPLA